MGQMGTFTEIKTSLFNYNQEYRVKVTRTIFSPTPFLTALTLKGKSQQAKAIVVVECLENNCYFVLWLHHSNVELNLFFNHWRKCD